MARYLYSTVFYLLIPIVCLRLWWRGRHIAGYRLRWGERFGFIDAVPVRRKVIWVHAVSVGETVAAVPMIKRLQQAYPDYLIAVTTTTPTGSERVTAMLGDSVYHCYAPYDLPDAVSRVLRRLNPSLLVIMETELWPNLIASCRERGVPVIVANARLSARSARGYSRFAALTTPMIRRVSMVAAQYAEDAERFVQLGLPESKLTVTGNIKFDFEVGEEQISIAAQLGGEWRGGSSRPIWLVASTHAGEDQIILRAFGRVRKRFPDTLLVLVPRHPDRFDSVATLCRDAGFSVVRRSNGSPPASQTNILLGDTMGELPLFFGACDLAFVGGSLVPVGGHNLLEPAAWRKPVLSGSQLFNFSEISKLLLAAHALELCDNEDEIASSVIALIGDKRLRGERGMAAHGVVEANRGAMDKLLSLIARSME